VVVGVNRFAGNGDTSAPQIEVFQIDPEIEPRQVARVQAVRASRDENDWRAAVAAIESAARGSDNLVPPILAAVEAHATVGEVADAMRRVFGEHRPSD
jgi:methylmalonyl-CoA mutase N-terminal domain/subunit